MIAYIYITKQLDELRRFNSVTEGPNSSSYVESFLLVKGIKDFPKVRGYLRVRLHCKCCRNYSQSNQCSIRFSLKFNIVIYKYMKESLI